MKKDDWRTARTGVKQFKAKNYSRKETARYAVEGKDGTLHVFGNTACHAALNGGHPVKKPIAILNQLQEYRAGEDVARRFYEWLFNYSPFHNVFVTKSAKRALSERVVVASVKPCGDILVGGLIAARLVTEDHMQNGNYRNGVMWHELVTRGVDPTLSFVISHALKPSKDFTTVEKYVLGHGAISVGNWYDSQPEHLDKFAYALCNDEPTFYQKKSWAEHPYYGHVSDTWQGKTKSKVVEKAFLTALKNVNRQKEVANNPFAVVARDSIPFYPLMDELALQLKQVNIVKENAIAA